MSYHDDPADVTGDAGASSRAEILEFGSRDVAGEPHVATGLGDSTKPTSQEVLRVDDLTVSFPTDDGLVQAVRGVSYAIREREVLGIVGESGSGKSVSSLAVMGLLPKSARVTGRILYR